ncbi:MAG: PBP1A family penicillin-binding protein [Desulfobacteraceae bacterium]|jgi:penicillin-binding protein 1A
MARIRFTKKTIGIFLIILIGALSGAFAGAFIALTHDLPQIRSLEDFRPAAVTRIYSSDKVLLAELFVEKREPVSLDVIPDYLTDALVATEDRKFFKHSGVDLKGITRAIIKDIWAGEFVEGASTITQQLARTLFLTHRKTLVRKIKEAILAFQLERRYTKKEILQLYLNQVYFGSGAYGVQSAAKIFFGKTVQDLTLGECALIAGMPKSPSRYSPLVNKELAVKRKNIVLRQMRDTGIIDEREYQEAINKELQLSTSKSKTSKAPYFVDYVKKFLEDILGSSGLYKSGLTIYTTLNYKLQQAADDAINHGLLALEKRMKAQDLPNQKPQAALISMDIQTGGILAMVGGRDYSQSPYNRVTHAQRQPGSAFKPVVYAFAIEKGLAQNKLLLDAPIAFKGAKNGKDWRPENFSQSYKGEMTLRQALAVSQNVPAVRLMETLGPHSVAQFGHSLGIETPLDANLSLALGTSEVTLIDLTSAFAVFPNKGEKVTPYGVVEVVDRQGRVIWRVKSQKRLVMSRSAAAIITDMLQGVIQEGTGRKARHLGRPLGGKTGTTNNCKDALFIGFSPSIAAGVWVGNDLGSTLGDRETGAKAALPIWTEFMSVALDSEPHQYFDIPNDVVQIRMNPETGRLASENSSRAVTALFKKGTDPKN